MSPAVRISLGLVALTVSILLAADAMLGIFPDDQRKSLVNTRLQYCETLATQFSALADLDQPDAMKAAMQSAVSRNDDVLSVAIRSGSGLLLDATKGHDLHWRGADAGQSTPTHVRVPVFENRRPWGHVEIAFEPFGGGWWDWLNDPLYRLVLITAAAGFALYLLFMKRTLRYLDPNAVVPGRVRAALDQLVEGVFLLDNEHNIVLANTAFAFKLGETPESLTGRNVSDLSWRVPGDAAPLPWHGVSLNGERRTDVRLELETPDLGVRSLSANIAPVLDGSGNLRGIMASFDDVSEVERVNSELLQTVSNLERAQSEIQLKNEELEVLATRDPLTGVFNRRAFFEKLETEYALARRDDLPLACIMADIDHFKSVNDNYGHAVGDVVIKQMAETLQQYTNTNGAVGRYGGEEFCVLLPGATADETAEIADQIRVAFAALSVEPDSATHGKPVTASFGISSAAFGSADAHGMVDQADQALYHSKTNGRNQATIWTSAHEKQEVAA